MRTADELMRDNLICRVKAGSHAYGTNIATSDVDIRGIFCADPINLLTPFFPIELAKVTDEEDTELYELSNYMKLYTQGNPNILETLWVDQLDVLADTEAYQILRNVRQDLLSSKVAFTFTGYAAAQIKKVKGREKWISNPKPVDPPKETDYISLVHNFTDDKIFNININDYQYGYRLIPYGDALFGLYKVDGYDTFDDRGSLNTTFDPETGFFTEDDQRRLPMFILKFAKMEYNRVHTDWKNYWEWKNNRNEVRAALEASHSYDTKNAMHCVRLMKMGVEILETGIINVKRPDADELLAIRNGAWTYAELLEYSEYMDNKIRNELYHKTSLPKTPNIKLAANTILAVQESMWYKPTITIF